MTKFESRQLRQALGTFATGVTVVTAALDSGEMAGVTANSFTSVSLDPPLILWCLASSSDSIGVFQNADYFAVNILASDQKTVSDHFARRQEDKFSSAAYIRGRGGAPLLEHSMTHLLCRTREQYELGDHWVFVGEVEEFRTSNREALLFHHGSYGTPLPLPGDESRVIGTIDKLDSNDDSLFSLLVRAIHTYQDKFESRQEQLIESGYEARIITVLSRHQVLDLNSVCQLLQMPKSDTCSLLNELGRRGLVSYDDDGNYTNTRLTADGVQKSTELHALAVQHDNDIYAMIGDSNGSKFRENLMAIINWGKD